LLHCPNQIISNERKIELVRGISRGMLHLHKYDIIHGDLCARNILLTSSGEPKISV
jgi:tRNA A-37 threonylcarbamoyl transferase component Bud32